MRKVILVSLAAFSMSVIWAQNPTRRAPVKPVEKQFDILLGEDSDTLRYIPVSKVDSFLKLPVYLKDKSGNRLESTAFDVMYSEWGLFEDSTGKEKIMSEYYTISVVGNKMPDFFSDNLSSIAKPGDTLVISRVWATKKDASPTNNIVVEASSRKFVIN